MHSADCLEPPLDAHLAASGIRPSWAPGIIIYMNFDKKMIDNNVSIV